MNNRYLIVVDMQNDFVDGALGTKEAVAIIPSVVEKIRGFDGRVIATLDTHNANYLGTMEGANLPVPHCIFGTEGHKINNEVLKALEEKQYQRVTKGSFGAVVLWHKILADAIRAGCSEDGTGMYIELIGLCTDICVVSNALILKSFFPEATIAVDPSCCAGATPEKHDAAIEVMRSCQVIIGDA